MPKVIHVVSDFSMGGVSMVVFDLVKNYKSSEYEYILVCLSGNGDASVKHRFAELGITIHEVKYAFQSGFSISEYFKEAFGFTHYRKKNQAAIDYIARLKPDILHFHTLPRDLMLGREVMRIWPCLLVQTDHLARLGKRDSHPISRFLLRIPFIHFYKRFHVIAVSDAVNDYLHMMGVRYSAKSITVIRNKIPSSAYRISYEKKDVLKVVYVARISVVKGHADLIHAWSKLPPAHAHLYVIGPDEMNGEIQNLCTQLQCENPVTFTGSIPDAAEFIKDADVAVFPSYREGLPLSLLEKMRIGLPCVVSDIPELSSIVQDGVNGLVYTCGDTTQLSHKLTLILEDLQLRSKLGAAAAHFVESVFVSKLGGIDKEYESYYGTILEANQS